MIIYLFKLRIIILMKKFIHNLVIKGNVGLNCMIAFIIKIVKYGSMHASVQMVQICNCLNFGTYCHVVCELIHLCVYECVPVSLK